VKQTIVLPRGATAAAERASAVVKQLPADKAWKVEISEYKKRRSDEQNRYLWGGVYPAILEAGGELLGGWTAEDLHEYLLGEIYGWEILEGFGRKRMRPIRRSSKMTASEFSSYVAQIQVRMAEHGIFVPDPLRS